MLLTPRVLYSSETATGFKPNRSLVSMNAFLMYKFTEKRGERRVKPSGKSNANFLTHSF